MIDSGRGECASRSKLREVEFASLKRGNTGSDPRGRHHGYFESFFGKFRDQHLSFEVFHRGDQFQSALTEFQDRNNNRRPAQTLGSLIPRHTRRSQGQQIREGNQTGQEMGTGHLRLILSNPAKQIVMHPP